MLVNNGPGLSPRIASQASRAAMGFRGRVESMRDGNDVTFGVLVGLGPADGQQETAWLELHVGRRECSQLRAPHRGGEAEQDDGVAARVESAGRP
jgi:hypothetical protein